MTMHVENTTTEQTTGTTTPPADTTQQAQQQGNQPSGETSQGTAQTEGQQQEGQQGQEQQRERDEQGRFKPPVQKRIDELTRARREAEREAETLRQQLQHLQGGAHSSGQAPATKPTPEQFGDYAQYVEALTAYQAQQILSQRDQAQAQTLQQRAQQAQQQADQARTQAWAERQQAVRTTVPDYDQVMSAAANVHVSAAVQDALLDSDMGPQLAYHLAKNPDLAQRLNGMPQRAVDREIGRLEASLSRPATPPVSKAPPPLKPLTGSGAATKSEAQMTDAEWYAARRAQRNT